MDSSPSFWLFSALSSISAKDSLMAAQQAAQMQAQLDAANKMYQQQTEQINRANQKTPDSGAMMSANAQRGKSGQSGTMLTGPTGLDLSQLKLGKSTLLGA